VRGDAQGDDDGDENQPHDEADDGPQRLPASARVGDAFTRLKELRRLLERRPRDLVRSLFTLGRTVPYGFVVARAGPARRGVVIR